MGNHSSSSSSSMSEEDLIFLKEHTHFTKKEILGWYKGFLKDCPNGKLSKEKFRAVYGDFFPKGNPEVFCEHVFRSFDTDHSGSIEFKEFLVAIDITSKDSHPVEKLNWAFRLYDIDGNGTIEKGEMENIIKAISKLLGENVSHTQTTPAERTRLIFQKVDKNGDGVISKEEFVEGCLSDPFLKQLLTVDTTGLAQ